MRTGTIRNVKTVWIIGPLRGRSVIAAEDSPKCCVVIELNVNGIPSQVVGDTGFAGGFLMMSGVPVATELILLRRTHPQQCSHIPCQGKASVYV